MSLPEVWITNLENILESAKDGTLKGVFVIAIGEDGRRMSEGYYSGTDRIVQLELESTTAYMLRELGAMLHEQLEAEYTDDDTSEENYYGIRH